MHKSTTAAIAVSVIALSAANVRGAQPGDAAAGANPINGTWKADVATMKFEGKSDEYLLKDGKFTCKSCTPAYAVPADGAFHPVRLSDADSDSVKVVNANRVIETLRKDGRQIAESTMTVSADGKTLIGTFASGAEGNGSFAKGEVTEKRIGAAPAGAHAISGKWQTVKLSNFNAAALTFTINAAGDRYGVSWPTGESYDAKLGGGDVPIKGDTAGTTASVRKVGDNRYEQIRKRNGQIVSILTLAVGPDGKLRGVSKNKLEGYTMSWTATKQTP